MLFDNWQGLLRVILVGCLAYIMLVIVLRLSGKRTLAKLNAFDLVVTVALGSTLATVLLTKGVALLEGIAAFALLALLQFIIAWSACRYRVVARFAKGKPRILLADGQMIDGALRAERVSKDEVKAAVRSAGIGDLGQVAAVVLETDGSLSVIGNDRAGARSAWPSEHVR
ncbi:hypothetical protein M527_04125 [Sphingobium indicum IP26]|uniref:Membrane protein n=1 Tax=Sphingobium indicum F2 TaxID=1450518 RepID=A0A8E0WWA2_9SPHN|nr:YetF domain-containing protein [Sphingobium indicum]EPR11273.1 hypothetical protein M527_04125 [Sphingobium indicum IP26]KER38053.1 membrane protein [Sphingobium indicum F2]